MDRLGGSRYKLTLVDFLPQQDEIEGELRSGGPVGLAYLGRKQAFEAECGSEGTAVASCSPTQPASQFIHNPRATCRCSSSLTQYLRLLENSLPVHLGWLSVEFFLLGELACSLPVKWGIVSCFLSTRVR